MGLIFKFFAYELNNFVISGCIKVQSRVRRVRMTANSLASNQCV